MKGRILFGTLLGISPVLGAPVADPDYSRCRKTAVAIIGAGTAGITAAQALANQSMNDFLILEYNDRIGGRLFQTEFGADSLGNPYTVELGANWIQGLGTEGGPENPIYTFAKKHNISNVYSNYSAIQTFDETGAVDYTYLLDEFEEAWGIFEQDAGYILTENLQDRSMRAGISMAGWKGRKSMQAQAVEWWMWDWETSSTPEESSFVYGIAGYNLSFYQFSEANNFVTDPRGFVHLLTRESRTFLSEDDPRLLLNTIVTDVAYKNYSVTLTTADGSCINAAYAIVTPSLGVLQNDLIAFDPPLPRWKQAAIATFTMGVYTKIFMQFNTTFWDPDTQFFLYASPTTRGYYPVFQSLSHEEFHPGSNILFVTVVGREALQVENQDDELTKAEIMAVLRQMFPDIEVPEPTAFFYPRWSTYPWAMGSYSNWPTGTTLEMHQNLRANVGRIYFAGEHTSAEYYGFVHGAWFEGREAGRQIAGLLGKECLNSDEDDNVGCRGYTSYGGAGGEETLTGTTEWEEWNAENGIWVDPFYVAGEDEEAEG